MEAALMKACWCCNPLPSVAHGGRGNLVDSTAECRVLLLNCWILGGGGIVIDNGWHSGGAGTEFVRFLK